MGMKIFLMGIYSVCGILWPCLSVMKAEAGQIPIQESSVKQEVTYLKMKENLTVYAQANLFADAIGSLEKGQAALSTGQTENGYRQVYYIGTIGYVPEAKTEFYLGNAEPMPDWEIDFAAEKPSINILGDSVTYGDKLSSQEQSYAAKLGVLLGSRALNNYGLNGSAIAGEHPDRFVDRYVSMETEADIILVLGGTNDYGCLGDAYGTELGRMGDVTDTTFYGGLNQLMCGLRQKYPDSEIVFLTPLSRKNENHKNEYGYALSDYVNAMKEMADFYRLRVIDLYAADDLDFSGSYAARLVDGLHPDAKGHTMIAEYLAETLQSW